MSSTPSSGSLLKILILASVAAALLIETWMASGDIDHILVLAPIAFVTAAGAARFWPERTVGAVMAIGYAVPAIYAIVHGHFRLPYLATWKCALAGALAPAIGIRWHWPARFRFAFAAWAAAVALTWPIVALREVDWMPSAFWVFPPAPSTPMYATATSVWVAQIAQIHLFGLLWIDWSFGRFADNGGPARYERDVVRPMFVAALAGAALAIYQGVVDLHFLSVDPWPEMGRASGPLADANASGALIALWVGLALAGATAARSFRAAVLFIVAACILVVAVWTTGSRTALLTAIVGSGAAVQILAARSTSRRRTLIAAAVGALVVAGAIVAVRPGVVGPIRRAQTLVPDVSMAIIRHAAWQLLWYRDGYGLIAARMIAEAPLQGVGIGAFHALSVEYAPSVTGLSLTADNAQNWYRHQLAELGIIGSVGWIAAAILFASLLRRRSAADQDRPQALAVKYSIVAFAIASMLGMPGQSIIVALTFVVFVAWLMLMTERGAPAQINSSGVKSTAAAAALAIALAVLLVWSGFRSFRPPFRAERFDLGYRYGWYVPFEGPAGRTQTTDHAVAVPKAAQRWLKLTMWVEHPDADAHPVLGQVWIDRERIVRRRFRRTMPLTKYVEIRTENRRFVIEATVDRTYVPPDRQAGGVGLNVAWEYVDRPPPQALATGRGN